MFVPHRCLFGWCRRPWGRVRLDHKTSLMKRAGSCAPRLPVIETPLRENSIAMSRQLYDDDDFYDDYGDDYDDYDDYARPPVPAKAPPKAPPKAPAAAKAPSAKPAAKPSPVAKNVTTGSLTHKSVPKPTTGTTESPSLSPKPVTSSAARAPTKPTKPSVHLIVVGHVDAGKSTLVGHFLHLLGEVSDNVLRKHQREATNAGKGSFAYAWALDENAEERARGVTMDVAGQHFETGSRHVVLLDAPGHRDLWAHNCCILFPC